MEKHVESSSPSYTEEIAEQLGSNLKGGEVVELTSDLGGGKTTFVRGLARGINSKDKVASPTFTISRIYKGPELDLHHFDFYRLQEPGIMTNELEEIIREKHNVVVIEWSDIVASVLPYDRLTVQLINIGDNKRLIKLDYPKSMEYLLKGLNI